MKNFIEKWQDDNERDIDSFAEQIAEPKHRLRKAWDRFKYHCDEFTWYICMGFMVLCFAILSFVITLLIIHGH